MNKAAVVTNLKSLLEQVGLTQTWAARKLSITPVYFNRVLSGDKTPSDDLAKKMDELAVTLQSSGLTHVS